jgi:hypothetical protein
MVIFDIYSFKYFTLWLLIITLDIDGNDSFDFVVDFLLIDFLLFFRLQLTLF